MIAADCSLPLGLVRVTTEREFFSAGKRKIRCLNRFRYWMEAKTMIGTKMVAVLLALAPHVAWAEPLKFEVASVKKGAGGGPPGDIPRNMDSSPGHFAMRNVPL